MRNNFIEYLNILLYLIRYREEFRFSGGQFTPLQNMELIAVEALKTRSSDLR